MKENAAEVLTHVRKNEEAVGDGSKVKKGYEKPKSKEHRIRDLKYGLEEPWCCDKSMSPVQSVPLAVFLAFLNLILPGTGTIFSACCAKKKDAN